MDDHHHRRASAAEASWDLNVVLRLDESGPEIGREPVRESDLSEIRSEAWFTGCLRAGHPASRMEDVPMRLTPLFAPGSSLCHGLRFEAIDPAGRSSVHEFRIQCLRHVADRGAMRLAREGLMKSLQIYFYELTAQPVRSRPSRKAGASTPAGSFTIEGARKSPEFLSVPLPRLLDRAEVLRPHRRGDPFPVFYTEAALTEAEQHARRGAATDPPRETGAVLLGVLCSCPQTGEAFVVVCDAAGVEEAEEKGFRLTYSGGSWFRIAGTVRAAKERHGTTAYRMVGQCHGHNFRPSLTGKDCDRCPRERSCDHTSAFLSDDDLRWSRAVFSHQPWALNQIFGMDGRGNPVHALYALERGIHRRREFHLIPDFDPTQWPVAGVVPAPRTERPQAISTKEETFHAVKSQKGKRRAADALRQQHPVRDAQADAHGNLHHRGPRQRRDRALHP